MASTSNSSCFRKPGIEQGAREKRSWNGGGPGGGLSTSVNSNLTSRCREVHRDHLCRYKGVHRIARLPLTYTFAHLFKYILLIFGWSGHHLHQFEFVTNVELHSGTYRPGGIKKHRSTRILEEPDREDDPDEWCKWAMYYSMARDDPVLRVSPREKSCEDDIFRGLPPLDMNNPEDRIWAQIQVPSKKDEGRTLGDVWNPTRKENASKGACSNWRIAIMLEYDLGVSWGVHITVDQDGDGHYMWGEDTPRNYPALVAAKGAPPLEDTRSYAQDIDPPKKTIPDLLYLDDTFERYFKGEICSRRPLSDYEDDDKDGDDMDDAY
ncbi:hypothetical protein BD413DRAFT_493056 [Trametes elegans]|nr:hypothetical protein BD413DRAFT_493056 [Trametes elegans]